MLNIPVNNIKTLFRFYSLIKSEPKINKINIFQKKLDIVN